MSIAILLLNLLPGLISAVPGISEKIKQIIADVSVSGAAVLASGAATAPSITTMLAAWAGVVSALKLDPSLPASSLNAITQIEKALQAALVEDAAAAKQVDWSQIISIKPV